jgi:hypothetical protein
MEDGRDEERKEKSVCPDKVGSGEKKKAEEKKEKKKGIVVISCPRGEAVLSNGL